MLAATDEFRDALLTYAAGVPAGLVIPDCALVLSHSQLEEKRGNVVSQSSVFSLRNRPHFPL